jgi:TRAP-type C4-dicarboxylate transport system substrate-binding protein
MEKKGFKVAGWLKNTPRYIMSQKKYTSMRDLSNQKIWCLPSSTLQDELLAYSAAPQILDPSDISVALENHTVDAVETDAIFMNSMGLGQSAKYLNRIPATPMINPFCFSYDWFEKLPKEYQDLLLATAQDIIRNQEAEYVDTVYEASLNGLQNAGVEIVETNTALLVELKSAAESVKTKFIATDADCASIYQELLKTIEAK